MIIKIGNYKLLLLKNKPKIIDKLISVTTNNVYEASYYLTKGAIIEDIRIRILKKSKNRPHREQWITTLSNVKKSMKLAWNDKKAMCNVKNLEIARYKLKKKVRKYKYELKNAL